MSATIIRRHTIKASVHHPTTATQIKYRKHFTVHIVSIVSNVYICRRE